MYNKSVSVTIYKLVDCTSFCTQTIVLLTDISRKKLQLSLFNSRAVLIIATWNKKKQPLQKHLLTLYYQIQSIMALQIITTGQKGIQLTPKFNKMPRMDTLHPSTIIYMAHLKQWNFSSFSFPNCLQLCSLFGSCSFFFPFTGCYGFEVLISPVSISHTNEKGSISWKLLNIWMTYPLNCWLHRLKFAMFQYKHTSQSLFIKLQKTSVTNSPIADMTLINNCTRKERVKKERDYNV